MKVYVVEVGVYEDRQVIGVYASVEAAMAAHPPRREGIEGDLRRGQMERPGGWRLDGGSTTSWWNGLDMGDCVSIEEYKVQR